MNNSNKVLIVNGVFSGYEGRFDVIRDVSMTVIEREIIAIIGPNGCGKSTLFKTIFGILKTKKGEILDTISSLEFRFPTLNDGITGSLQSSKRNDIKRQYAIYASSITKINGQEVDTVFKRTWGTFILERMFVTDIEKLSSVLTKYGVMKHVERTCLNCDKVWNDPVDVSGFFVSGLQL